MNIRVSHLLPLFFLFSGFRLPAEDLRFEQAIWQLIHAVDAETKNGFVVTPLPATDLLSLMYLGSERQTEDILKKKIFQGLQQEDVRKVALQTTCKERGYASLSSLWFSREVRLRNAFQQAASNEWNCHIQKSPLRTDAQVSADLINTWYRKHTLGAFPAVIRARDILPHTDLVVLNVSMFQQVWAKPYFHSNSTHLAPFYLKPSEQKQVATMRGRMRVLAFENEEVTALSLPFAEETFSLFLLVPKDPITFSDYRKQFSAKAFANILKNQKVKAVEVHLPKIDVRAELDLRAVWQNQGVRVPFEPGKETDFSGVNGSEPAPLYISRYQQQVRVTWNEKGAKASAVTDLMAMPFGPVPTPTPVVYQPILLNKPFLFLIYKSETREIFFAGLISDWSQFAEVD